MYVWIKNDLDRKRCFGCLCFLSTGGTIDDYPNKEELQRVKSYFKRLAGL